MANLMFLILHWLFFIYFSVGFIMAFWFIAFGIIELKGKTIWSLFRLDTIILILWGIIYCGLLWPWHVYEIIQDFKDQDDTHS